MNSLTILPGDCRQTLAALPAESVHCCITSPPYYGLRDYGCAGQIGLEQTPEAFVAELVAVFREVRRVLRADGTLWLNLGDSYAGGFGGAQGANGQMASRSVATARSQVRNRLLDAGGLPPKNLIGIKEQIRSAYGIAGDGSDYAAKTAGHDPLLLPGRAFRGLPMRWYASAADATVPKAANADPLAALVAPYAPESSVVVCSGAHGDASHFQPSDVVAFFNRCIGR